MSWLDKIGKIQFWDIFSTGVEEGVIEGIKNSYKANELGLDSEVSREDLYTDQSIESYNSNIGTNAHNAAEDNIGQTPVRDNNVSLWDLPVANYVTGAGQDYNHKLPIRSNSLPGLEDVYEPEIPDWGYADWINERSLFQKQIGNLLDEPGWFYFKVFFKFGTDHGLFGGIFSDSPMNSINSAAKYLYICKNQYRQEKLLDRLHALEKFTSLLSNIVTMSPWLFKDVKGLDKVSNPVLDKFNEEKYIEIGLNKETTDLRLSTMMSLYMYACYDNATSKEIIPENLRKFDMSVVLFASPIKKIHTAIYDEKTGKKFPYKKLTPGNSNNNWDNVMSFKIYEFKNCEFDTLSFSSVLPGSMSNEAPFGMGESSLKIRYDRVYEHTMNEFNRIMFGSKGFYYSDYTKFNMLKDKTRKGNNDAYLKDTSSSAGTTYKDRYEAIASIFDNMVSNGYTNTNIKKLVEASESLIHSRLAALTANKYSIGNIYGQEQRIHRNYSLVKSETNNPNDLSNLGDYFLAKIKLLKDRSDETNLERRALNWLIEKLFRDRKDEMSNKFGNIWGQYGIYKKKLRQGTHDKSMLYTALQEVRMINAQRGLLDFDRYARTQINNLGNHTYRNQDIKDALVNSINPFITWNNNGYNKLKTDIKKILSNNGNKSSIESKLLLLYNVFNSTYDENKRAKISLDVVDKRASDAKGYLINSMNNNTTSPIWSENYNISKTKFINSLKARIKNTDGSITSIIDEMINMMNNDIYNGNNINQDTVNKRQYDIKAWLVNSANNTTI